MKREGFALLLVLLVVVALELITLSTLALSAHESAALAAHERGLVAARAAESALRGLARAWPLPALDSLRLGQDTTIRDTGGVVTTVRRETPGVYLATASVPAGPALIRETALLQTLDFDLAMLEAHQAIVANQPVVAPNTRFAVDTSLCNLPPLTSGTDSVRAATPGYAFGGLRWDQLHSIADTGFIFVGGDTVLVTGAAAGVLAVAGNLTIGTGVQFRGLLVVKGHVVIEDHVHITGAIISRSSAASSSGAADVVFSRCAVAGALRQTRATQRLVRSQRRFIPAF